MTVVVTMVGAATGVGYLWVMSTIRNPFIKIITGDVELEDMSWVTKVSNN